MHPLARLIVDVPDFPQPGILFRDITPLLRTHFAAVIAALDELFSAREWSEADAVAGIESRGFILAAALAEKHGKGFVPIRKKGKLPPPVVERPYALEYGAGVLEMQRAGEAVGMVGDGVNDAPALAQADVSFAMGAGSGSALSAADITILRDDLRAVPAAISLSLAR